MAQFRNTITDRDGTAAAAATADGDDMMTAGAYRDCACTVNVWRMCALKHTVPLQAWPAAMPCGNTPCTRMRIRTLERHAAAE